MLDYGRTKLVVQQAMEFFQVDGKFNRSVMAQRLQQINMTPASFDARMRRDLVLSQLPDAVSRSEFATPAELARAVALRDQARAATWIAVPAVKFLGDVRVGAADAEAWYQAHPERFKSEETVTLDYLELTPAALPATTAPPTDAELRELYAQEADRYRQPEQRLARHILIEGQGADAPRADAIASELVARLAKGEDFAKLAKQYSADHGSAAAGGSLGWLERGTLPGPFEDALFAMQRGEVRGPVRSEFGAHVIRLDELRPEQGRPYEQVRDELVQQWQEREAAERFSKAGERFADLVYANADSLAPAAESLGLKVQRVSGVTRTGGAEVAAEQVVRDAAFSVEVLNENRNSAPLELGPERLVVVRIAEHVPAAVRPFAEVRENAADALRDERTAAAAQALAERVAAQLRAGAAPAVVAKQERLPPPATRTLHRDTQDAPVELARALFAAERPGSKPVAGVAVLRNGDRVVFRLEAVEPGDLARLSDAERDQRRGELAREHGVVALTAYAEALKRIAEVRLQADKAQ